MKYLVLGLFSLSLLGFDCAQIPENISLNATTAMAYINTSSTTWPSNDSSTNTISNNSSTGTPPSSAKTSTTTTQPAATLSPVSTMTTKNGDSHVFTSVSLLFGSSVLHALWQ